MTANVPTRHEVLDRARSFFEYHPWLVDLVRALCDGERVCVIKGLPGKATGGSVEWPPEKESTT